MPQHDPRYSLRVLNLLLPPVQALLNRVLPQVTERELRSPKYRQNSLLLWMDALLVAEQPQAAQIPPETRRAVLQQILELHSHITTSPAAVPTRRSTMVTAAEEAATTAAFANAGWPPPSRQTQDLGLGVRSISLEAPQAEADELSLLTETVTGSAWSFEPVAGLPGFFRLKPAAGVLPTVPAAWDLARRIKALPGVIYAEPSIYQLPAAADVAAREDVAAAASAFSSSSAGANDHGVKETETLPEWSLDLTKARDLWGSHQGEGILIGHIDTGYTRHSEVLDNVDITRGYDTWNDDPDAEDDLNPSFWDSIHSSFMPAQPGHGTSTGSLIASPVGRQPKHEGTHGVTGTAPRATLVPVRATPTVVILPTGSQDEAAEGIVRAVASGVHVISMSLGSPWFARPLEAAVEQALGAGVIVCAAAGNVVLKDTWFTNVMYPAAFPGVIAVAGCDFKRRPWRNSCRGLRVNVTAPGTDVWVAAAEITGSLWWVEKHFTVARGSGTSFAVATLAGIAACWLRHWTVNFGGRMGLISHLGGQAGAIPAAFCECLRRHEATPMDFPVTEPEDLKGYVPANYPPNHFGVGIVNAATLIKVEPKAPDIAPAALATASAGSWRGGSVVAELGNASGHSVHDVRRALMADLGLEAGGLEAWLKVYGRELLHHFATSATLRRRLTAVITPAAAVAAAAEFGAPPAPDSLKRQLRVRASASLAGSLPS